MAERLLKVDKRLIKCVEDWYNCGECHYEYEDISLDFICHKLGISLPESIFIMNIMLRDPGYAKRFKERKLEIL